MLNLRTRTKLAVLAATTATVTVALPAAPADAAIGAMSAQLSITKLAGTANVCNWKVTGVVSMPQAEAQQLLDTNRPGNGYRVIFRAWGDDPVSDDYLFGPDPASTTATPQGIAYTGTRGISCTKRNEDVSRFDNRDELYVGVRLVNGFANGQYGATVKSGESNRIIGYF
jgi:hypothetical protein